MTHLSTLMQMRRRQLAAAIGGGPPSWVMRSGGVAANLDFDFVNDLAWNGSAAVSIASLLACTRASSGYYDNVAGVLSSFNNNVLRYGDKGLLVESSRTNLVLQSSDFTDAAWTKSNMTTAKTATGPDGVVNSASTLTATAGNATALQAITSASAARITSVYIKRRTGTGNIDITQDNGSTWATKAVTAAWVKYEIASVTSANPTVGIRIVTSGDAVDVWVFQHELGAFTTSPIPTTTTTVTRAADFVSRGTGSDISVTANSVYAEFNSPASAGVRGLAAMGGISFRIGTFLTISLEGGSFVAASGNTFSNGVTAKAAIAYVLNDGAACLNGDIAQIGTDNSGTPDAAPSDFVIGDLSTSTVLPANAYIRRIALWRSRLSNGALQTLTA